MRQINGLRDTHTKKKQRRYSDENIQQKITATEGCTVMGQARYTHGIRTAHAQHIQGARTSGEASGTIFSRGIGGISGKTILL